MARKAKKRKLKTRKGVAKRFKLTKTGKIKRSRAYKSHILSKKTSRRKRRLRKPDLVSAHQTQQIKRMLPYG
ncbi:50S ribosomal protein L35 [Candidatus Omnitrophota bacterium]